MDIQFLRIGKGLSTKSSVHYSSYNQPRIPASLEAIDFYLTLAWTYLASTRMFGRKRTQVGEYFIGTHDDFPKRDVGKNVYMSN